MHRICKPLALALFAATIAAPSSNAWAWQPAQDGNSVPDKADHDKPVSKSKLRHPVLRTQRTDISKLDLFYGMGGQDKVPKPPFHFLEEDKNGTNPKMDVRDADGKKWRVKLGPEARPEVTASRLLWAMGYFTNEDYVEPTAQIEGMEMKRGKKDIGDDGTVEDARFARKPEGQKKLGTWEWKDNPFLGQRDFNGLRVMMALLNSWDLKDVNNAVFVDKNSGRQFFLVSDIGATFGGNAIDIPIPKSKGNVETYEKSGFIEKVHDNTVDFATPKAPKGMLIKSAGVLSKDYFRRKGFDWIGNDIPVADARWVGEQLGQLSHDQLRDAFRAGHFPDGEIERYVAVVELRINALKAL